VEDVYVRYGEKGAAGSKDALNGVTVRVPRGTLFMLLGPNGSGKSTLLRTMAGLVTPWSGRLRVQAPRAFVFQNPDHQVIMPTVGLGCTSRIQLPHSACKRLVSSTLATVM
jgi:energy-coupling factor transporter ATP-binding protein EcfA2